MAQTTADPGMDQSDRPQTIVGENNAQPETSTESHPETKEHHDDSSLSSQSSPVGVDVEKPQQPKPDPQPSQAENLGPQRVYIVMFSLCMALFLAALDVTIITTALPTIAAHFHATSSGYTWIGSAYLLANAASTPLWGKFSDIWGRKPVLVAANVVFMIGSLIAALSVTIGMLIVGRVVQGLGGGGLIVLVSIAVSDLFSMRERPKWLALTSATWAIASGVGPLIGGAFTESVSWRWCFWINLPLDGVSLVLLIFFLKLETPKTPFIQGIKAIDWLGGLTVVGGIVMFLFGFAAAGSQYPWGSAFVLCLIIFGVVTLVLFGLIEWKIAKYPIMPPRIFNDWSNVAAYAVCYFFGFVFIAEAYYLPLYFQTVLGLSPILSGVVLLALVVPLSLASISCGILMKKTGRYQEILWVSGAIFLIGAGLLINLPVHRDWAKIIIYPIIAGLGTGPLFQAPLVAIQSHLKGYDMATGTAMFGFVRNIATSMSIVLGGVVFTNQLKGQQDNLEKALGPQLAAQFSRTSFGASTADLARLPPAQRQVLNNAYASSLRTMWIFYTAFAAALLFSTFFITKVELSKQHEKANVGVVEQEKVRREILEENKAKKLSKANAKKEAMDLEASRPKTTL